MHNLKQGAKKVILRVNGEQKKNGNIKRFLVVF